jgi:hypothetical protein
VGDTIHYKVEIENTGDTPLTVTPADLGCTPFSTTPFSLAKGAIQTVNCEHVAAIGDGKSYPNEACATGVDSVGGTKGTVEDCDDVDIPILNPGIAVRKIAAEKAVHEGDVINYTVEIENTGDTPLTVTPADLGCTPFSTTPFSLAVGAIKTVKCSHLATAADGKSYLNEACATGVDSVGGTKGTVNGCDDVDIPILHPGIAVTKTAAETSVITGQAINYTVAVANTGDTPLAVTASDLGCTGFGPAQFNLAVGASQEIKCAHLTVAGDPSPYRNEACATGLDSLGGTKGTVNACNFVDVPHGPASIAPPAGQVVAGERITPGTARLLGPTGCTARAFNARVRGTKIARVVFVLDGKVLKRFSKPNKAGSYALRINPAKLRIGVHRLVATVTFQSGSNTRAKKLRLSFQRCARKLAEPRFTG